MRPTKSTPYLVRRGNTYYFRRAIPPGLRARFGKREIKLSLATFDPRRARRAGRLMALWSDAIFEAIIAMPTLGPEEIDALVRSYFAGAWAQQNGALSKAKKADKEGLSDSLYAADGAIELFRRQLQNEEFDAATIAAVQSAIGFLPKEDSPEFRQAARGVLLARLELARIYMAQVNGDYEDAAPKSPLFSGIVVTHEAGPQDTQRRFGELVTLFLKERADEWAPSTKAEIERALAYARELVGEHKPIAAVSVDDVRLVRDVLKRLPKHFGQAPEFAGKSLQQIAQEASSDKATIAPATVHKYLSAHKSFLGWCVDEGYRGDVPGQGIRAQGLAPPVETRRPFTTSEIKHLFGSPQWTGHLSPSRRHVPGSCLTRDHKYWVPLIGILAGLRLGEILQLRVSDIREEGGIWHFDVNAAGEKSVKTPSSIRRVPLHPLLVGAGLLDWIVKSKNAQTNALFPTASLGGNKVVGPFSKWWSRYLGHIGLGDPALTFHSLRHTFVDALRGGEVDIAIIQAIAGHSPGTVTGGYGKGYPLGVLAKAVNKMALTIHLPVPSGGHLQGKPAS